MLMQSKSINQMLVEKFVLVREIDRDVKEMLVIRLGVHHQACLCQDNWFSRSRSETDNSLYIHHSPSAPYQGQRIPHGGRS
jgi:hypothetical protein